MPLGNYTGSSEEYISHIGYSFTRLREAALSVALPRKDQYRLCSMKGMVRLLVFTILLCPLFALYMFGLFVSPWISLWRLCRTIIVRHGYMWSGEKRNLKPALLVLYSLALLQGVLFYYWAISASVEKTLVQHVAEAYEIDEDDEARESVSDYLRMIREGCEKDLSFARGRNLITYAVDLMASNSPDNYLSAARILDTLIRQLKPTGDRQHRRIRRMVASASSSDDNTATRFNLTVVNLPGRVVKSQHSLIKNMIGSTLSSDAVKILVQMLDSKDEDGGKISEMRLRAMRIVAHFASEIRLDKIMYGIRNICSLLEHQGSDSSQGSDSEKYQVFLVYSTGIHILSELAKDEENFKHMSNTDGIIRKIVTVIVKCKELHQKEHEEWLSIARPGMQLINRLAASASSKSINVQQLSEFLGHENGTTTLQNMLDCQKCKADTAVQRLLIKTLTQIISMNTSQQNLSSKNKERNKKASIETQIISAMNMSQQNNPPSENIARDKKLRESFIKSLLLKFLDGSDTSFRKLAGESLAQLSLTSLNNCKLILNAQVGIVDALATVLLKDKDEQYRKSAADILEHLCRHYTNSKKGGSAFNNLGVAMTRDIKHVLDEVLMGDSDSRRSSNYVDLHEALASLCDTVNVKLISVDPNLVSDFDTKAKEICEERDLSEMSFSELVRKAKEIVEKHRKRLDDWAFSSDDDDDDDCCIM
ncbi:hypothetical protein GQ55_2G080600 [Panicum hallii var. hallii]|uniref:Uncharacterized protein n=1 Tax=Panicum hallii var. hallii TaxID=1504633 RepID=A0A2T7EMN0_9POAL|nr:hypothetical protein GQ55_2G080600 [Panicum hallii var. hallii]